MSFQSGDIDPGLSFGHGLLTPGSGNGARFDFWLAPDGVVDGTGFEGGCGASTDDVYYAAGGDDLFLGSLVLNEDGVDQYQGGAGLDIDSFASSIGLTNITGEGADGTVATYGRVFESDIPQVGDWYYVGPPELLNDLSGGGTLPNVATVARSLGIAGLDPIDGTPWSFQVITGSPTSTTSTTSTSSTTTTTTTSTSTTSTTSDNTTSTLGLVNLIGHWRFDEMSGTNAHNDIGTGDGNAVGDGLVSWNPSPGDGKFGGYVTLDGFSGFLCDNEGNFDVSGKEVTFMTWIRTSNFDNWYLPMITKGDNTSYDMEGRMAVLRGIFPESEG